MYLFNDGEENDLQSIDQNVILYQINDQPHNDILSEIQEENELLPIKSDINSVKSEFNCTTEKTPSFFEHRNKKNLKKMGTGKSKFMGRKRMNEKHDLIESSIGNKTHDKYSEDNLMRKIKSNIMDYILNKLNCSLYNKSYKFIRIDKHINENLKKDFNIKLMNQTILNIIYNSEISSIYKKFNHDNRTLLNKIIAENLEIKTIKILKMKFIDIINEIREKNLDYFLNKIEEKENRIKKNENINEYINSLKNLFFNYENWFFNKQGRNRKNKEICNLFL